MIMLVGCMLSFGLLAGLLNKESVDEFGKLKTVMIVLLVTLSSWVGVGVLIGYYFSEK